MVKYMVVSFKKDQIAALYFAMSDIVYAEFADSFRVTRSQEDLQFY